MQRNILAKTSSTVRSKSGTLRKFLIVPATVNGTNGIHHYYNNNFVATQFRCGHTSNNTSIVARVSGKTRQFHRGIVEHSEEAEKEDNQQSTTEEQFDEHEHEHEEEEGGLEAEEENEETIEEEEEGDEVHEDGGLEKLDTELLNELDALHRKGESLALIEKIEAQPNYELYPTLTAMRASAKAKLGKIDEAIEDAFHFSEKQKENFPKKWANNFNMLLSVMSISSPLFHCHV